MGDRRLTRSLRAISEIEFAKLFPTPQQAGGGTGAVAVAAPLQPAQRPGEIIGQQAQSQPTPGSTGGGLISPITETSWENRKFHPIQELRTSDGIFVFSTRHVKSLLMKDAIGRDVVLVFQDRPSA